jgi:hypothetical protein
MVSGPSRDGADAGSDDDGVTTIDDRGAHRDRRSRANPGAVGEPDNGSTSELASAEDPSGSAAAGSDQQGVEGSGDAPATPDTVPADDPDEGLGPSGDVSCVDEAPTSSRFSLDWRPPALPPNGTVVYLEWSGTSGADSRTFTLANSEMKGQSGPDWFRLALQGDEQWSTEFAPAAGQVLGCGGWAVSAPEEPPILKVWPSQTGCAPTGEGGFVVDSYRVVDGGFSDIEIRFSREGCGRRLWGYVRYDADDPTLPPAPVAASGFGWSPPAGVVPATGDYLYVDSTAGDYIGQGATELFTSPTSTFDWTWSPGALSLKVQAADAYWRMSAVAPLRHDDFMVGWYRDLARAAFSNPAEGGIDVSAVNRGCNTLLGQFVIDRFDLDVVEGRFEQRCDHGPPLYGAFRDVR